MDSQLELYIKNFVATVFNNISNLDSVSVAATVDKSDPNNTYAVISASATQGGSLQAINDKFII